MDGYDNDGLLLLLDDDLFWSDDDVDRIQSEPTEQASR